MTFSQHRILIIWKIVFFEWDINVLSSFSRSETFDASDNDDMGHNPDSSLRIVISAPDKTMPLEKDDIAFMLVQYDKNAEDEGEGRDREKNNKSWNVFRRRFLQ